MRARLLLSESLRSLSGNLSTTVAAAVTVLIGMFLLGLSIALGSWVLSYSNHIKRELVVKVYFCTDLSCDGKERTTANINAVRDKLLGMNEVKNIDFVSKTEALKIEQKEHPEFTRVLPGNPLPDSFTVTPKRGEDVETIAATLGTPAGVQKVCPPPPGTKLPKGEDCGRRTTHRVLRFAKVVEVVFGIAVLVLLGSAMLLIANTIRLSIFARRREIEVMKLVGATNWFVRGPFMLEGLLCGLGGSLAAVILLVLGKEIALPSILGRIDTEPNVHALQFGFTALILLGAGLLIGAAGSGLTLRRFLKV